MTRAEQAALFNQFCTDWGIRYNRAGFHSFCTRTCPGEWTRGDLSWALANWAWKHDALIAAEDARDLHDTQQDALI